MLLVLSIKSYKNIPTNCPVIATFDQNGGGIGRSLINDLVLPDPERHVSANHAKIEFRDGKYFVKDISTNGVFINQSSVPLGSGNSIILNVDDCLFIGEYEIYVSFDSVLDSQGEDASEKLEWRKSVNQRGIFKRPFELLKLIRDGVVTSLRDLGVDSLCYVSTFAFPLQDYVDAFHSLGWITVNANERLEPTERIVEMQRALDLSLTQLAPYSGDSVVVNPLFGPPSVPPAPAEVFVLMPFAEDLKPVYEDHVKAVATKLGTMSARADDFFAANSVIADVWNAIFHARVLIADCTRRNPNVFYELGIAHTLGKSVILITQDKDDIPFDIQHMRTILYDFTPRGMLDFQATLEEALSHELKIPQGLSDLLVVKEGGGG